MKIHYLSGIRNRDPCIQLDSDIRLYTARSPELSLYFLPSQKSLLVYVRMYIKLILKALSRINFLSLIIDSGLFMVMVMNDPLP